jgi:hypothetical protein
MPTIANPAQHVLSNAGYANSAEQFIEVMREQHKEGRFRLRQDLPDRTDRMIPARFRGVRSISKRTRAYSPPLDGHRALSYFKSRRYVSDERLARQAEIAF